MAKKQVTMTLSNVVIQKVGVPGGSGTFVFEQAAPATLWDIQHDMDKYPSVTVVDSAKTVVYGEVEYISKSHIVIHFNAEFSGTAYLN